MDEEKVARMLASLSTVALTFGAIIHKTMPQDAQEETSQNATKVLDEFHSYEEILMYLSSIMADETLEVSAKCSYATICGVALEKLVSAQEILKDV